ncbi:hypothetical protein [Tautonia rosea]|uniref:hypothetical protein n=1 Tax=Tautonia rosea TaxID=2728037 RepID=UPI001474AE41|nr:hypothetical protein [Tautonia rosea]
MPATRFLILTLALVLGGGLTASAQDDALDRLLDEIQQGTKPSEKAKSDVKGASDEDKKSTPTPLGDDEADVDKLLEGLIGPRSDRPDADGQAPSDLGLDAMPDRPDRLRDEARGELDREEQAFDDYLRRLLGRIDPPKDEDQRQQASKEGGPLSETMEKMREVEKRLSELDTGGQTREQQEQIVRDFDELLRRIRQQQQQQQRQQQQTEMAGQQPQDQGQDQNGENNGEQTGAPPKTPEQNPALVNAKDSWGHLQDSLREVMGNVSRMMPLDQRRELIERYFLSVAKKGVER